MKKLFCVLAALLALSCAAFAQESEKKWYDDLSAGALFRLGIPVFGLEVHTNYDIPLTDSMHIGLGLNFNLCLSIGISVNGEGRSISGSSTILNASFWYKDFYASYGLGLGPGCFIPYDVRIGWLPENSKKDKGACFNMEVGLIAVGTYSYVTDENNQTDESYIGTMPCFFTTLGCMYKF